MNIPYTKDYDTLIRDLEKQIGVLKQEKLKEKEKYFKDNKINCDTCRYSWLDDMSVDMHTLCEKGNCMLCCRVCEEYEKDNETSKYLKRSNALKYENNMARAYDSMFGGCIADAPLGKAKIFCEMYIEK